MIFLLAPAVSWTLGVTAAVFIIGFAVAAAGWTIRHDV